MANEKISITIEAINNASAALNSIKNDLKGMDDSFKKSETGMQSFQKQLGGLGSSLTKTGAIFTASFTVPIVTGLAAVAKSAVTFEDSLANVQKTTGATGDDLKKIGKDLLDMSAKTRTSAEELVKIATIGGQMGVAAEDVVGFTDAIDKANVALGDEFSGGAEEITQQMGQLRNLFGDIKSDNISEDILHISNAVNSLGASGLATGGFMTEAAKRISGITGPLGQTSGEVLGLAATMEELGFNVERGSSAVTRTFQEMATNTKEFAKIAGVSTKEFSNLVDSDINGAFVKVLDGINELNPSATEMATILDDLGLSGVGNAELFLKMAGATDLLTQKQDQAAVALGNTDSILAEYNAKNQTTAAELEKLKNNFNILAVTLGSVLLPAINQIIQQVTPLVQGFTKFAEANPELVKLATKIALVAAAVGPLVLIMGGFVSSISALISPVGLIVAGLSVLAGVLAKMGIESAIAGDGMGVLGDIFESVKGVVAELGAFFVANQDTIMAFADSVLNLLGAAFQAVEPLISPIVSLIGEVLPRAFTFLQGIIEPVTEFISSVIAPAFKLIADVVGPLVPVIGQLLGGAFSYLSGIISTVAGILSGVLGPAINLASSLFGPLASLLGKFLVPVLGFLGDVISVVAEGLGGALVFAAQIAGDALNVLSAVIDTVVGWFRSAAEWLGIIDEKTAETADKLDENSKRVKDSVDGFEIDTTSFGEGFDQLTASSSEAAASVAQSLIKMAEQGDASSQDFAKNLKKAGTSIEELKEGAKDGTLNISKAFKSIQDASAKSASSFEDGGKKMNNSLVETANQITEFSKVTKTSTQKASGAVDASSSDIKSSLSTLDQAALKTSSVFSSDATEGFGDFGKIGADSIDELVKSTEGGGAQITNATGELSTAAVQGMQGLPQQMDQVAAQAVAGFVNGIKSRIGQAAIAAAGMAAAASSAAKSALDIHSPSKVFEEIGGDTTAGFALGIQRGTPAVLDEINRLAHGTIEEQKDLVSKLESALAFEGGAGITRGGKVVETFSTIEGAIEGCKSALKDLNEESANFTKEAELVSQEIVTLASGFEIPDDAIDTYDELEGGLEGIRDALEEAQDTHQAFIDSAKDGLDDYEKKLGDIEEKFQDVNDKFDEIGKKFDETLKKAFEDAGGEVGDSVVNALEKEKELNEQILEVKNAIAEKEAELAMVEASGEDNSAAKKALEDEQEKLSTLEGQKTTVEQMIASFNELNNSAETLTAKLQENAEATAKAEEQLTKLQGNSKASADQITQQQERINELKQQELILVGKQILSQQSLEAANAKIKDAKEKANLSELDYIALNLAREKQAIEEKKANALAAKEAELAAVQKEKDALLELKKVQEAIISGKLGDLDTKSLTSDEAIKLAEQAKADEEAYRGKLATQMQLLEEFKATELALYDSQKAELEAQQAEYESFVLASYDKIIGKLDQLRQAAVAAAAAQSKVKGGGFSEGGFTGFDVGGFTAKGNIKDIAGVVHKGEWVAPNWMVRQFADVFRGLEGVRQGKLRGFDEGGFTSPPAAPPQNTFNQPININATVQGDADFNQVSRYLAWRLRTG